VQNFAGFGYIYVCNYNIGKTLIIWFIFKMVKSCTCLLCNCILCTNTYPSLILQVVPFLVWCVVGSRKN